MSHLCVFHESNTRQPVKLLNHQEDIAVELSGIGVSFARQELAAPVTTQTSSDEVLAAYRAEIERLYGQQGYTLADVIRLDENQPEKERNSQRAACLVERTGGREALLFVAGRGLCCLHVGDEVYAVMCEKGDLLSIPAGMKRWFDAGEHPRVVAIRLLASEDDRTGQPTGDDPASQYPDFDDY